MCSVTLLGNVAAPDQTTLLTDSSPSTNQDLGSYYLTVSFLLIPATLPTPAET